MYCLESHITKFVGYGYTVMCHMGNEDRKALMENVGSIPRDDEKTIEIHGGAGELGKHVLKVAEWKTKCKNYFNRYYKTSNNIMVPSDGDTIMNSLSSVCSENKGRGFVIKNYNIAKHLEFLGFNKTRLEENLGAPLTSKSISYIAYSEQRNVVFICEKITNGFNMGQYLKNIVVMVKYFITVYDNEIQASGVKIVGILIREKKEQEELTDCSFCHLFSPSYKDFKSPATFKIWLKSIETYEGWWDLANSQQQNNLFDDLAAEISCFMAVQEKGFSPLTGNKSKQFKQTYFLYTPQQMDIHFSDVKHVVIQGSYGSGKSLLGLKKLELIWKNLGTHEKIIYINFDHSSNLHFLMKKNLKEYAAISRKKIKLTSGIQDISKSPSQSVYVCHNNEGRNLSAILDKTRRLNLNVSENPKINYHLIVEEYDGETLTHDEVAKITGLIKGGDFLESNIMLLAQPLMKKRSWNIGKQSYETETCIFYELENSFKIVQLEEVLRCSNQICGITKAIQNFVRNKESVFTTEIDNISFEQGQQEDNEKHLDSHRVPDSNYSGVETSRNENFSNQRNAFIKADKIRNRRMDLDQAFERSAPLQKSKAARSKIVSKFGFLCEPKKGVDIEGLKPNLVEFSENINLSSDIAVISLTLVLRDFIGKNETTTVLYMTDDQPQILKRTFQVLSRLDKTFSYTQDIEEYLQKNKKSKTIFASNFRSVNGMEFDHVVIVVAQSEYYMKYYLPQVISRCMYDLSFVLLPKVNFSFKPRAGKTGETVANMIEELKRESLVNQIVLAECKDCGNNCDYSFSIVTDDKLTFDVHTHSGQYKEHLHILAEYKQVKEQEHPTSPSAIAEAE